MKKNRECSFKRGLMPGITVFVCHDKCCVFVCFFYNKFPGIVYCKQTEKYRIPFPPRITPLHVTVINNECSLEKDVFSFISGMILACGS